MATSLVELMSSPLAVLALAAAAVPGVVLAVVRAVDVVVPAVLHEIDRASARTVAAAVLAPVPGVAQLPGRSARRNRALRPRSTRRPRWRGRTWKPTASQAGSSVFSLPSLLVAPD